MTALLTRFTLVAGALLAALLPGAALADAGSVRIARQYGIGYLQTMVMEHEKLIEKRAPAQGLPDITVTWSTFGDGTVANDAIISGNLDYAAGGLGSFVTLWDRTRGTLGVKGVAALNSMPMLLNSRNPAVRTIRDLTEQDRVALAGVKVSSQAVTLQQAAAQAFGEANWSRLDPLTVNLPHPTAMQALLQARSDVTAHFGSPPYQSEELKQSGVHTILNSYDVWGGPQTFILAWTSSKFREQNSRLHAAFMAALAEATALVNADKRRAAAIYLAMTGDKTLSEHALVDILSDPQVRFTLTPENVARFVAFRVAIGTIRTRPDSWKDLFFNEVHALPGS